MLNFWKRLVGPPSQLTDSKQRQAYLLNVLLTIVGAGAILLVPLSQINDLLHPNLTTLLPEVGGMAAVIICYFLNRFNFTWLSAILFFLSLNILVVYYISGSTDDNVAISLQGVPPLLIVPIMAAGVILGPRYSFLFAGISMLGTIILALFRSGTNVPHLGSSIDALAAVSVPVTLLLVTAALSWFFESNLQRLVGQLIAQNSELEGVNRELEKKRKAEQQLNQRINSLTGEVTSSFAEQSNNTNNQLSALLEVTTTVEELSATNEAIARVSNQVDTTAQNALRVAEEGTSNVRNGLEALNKLYELAQSVAAAMDDLYSQARQIDQIIELITEVAEETNLLALNATIEAAGAREYGRRFASVANEVQRLANRSRDAADQVRQVVNETRQAIENSSEVAQRGVREAADIMSGTREIEHILAGIVAMVENTATLTRQISLSIQQQRGATVHVVDTMHQISNISQQVSQGSQDLMGRVYELNQVAVELIKGDDKPVTKKQA